MGMVLGKHKDDHRDRNARGDHDGQDGGYQDDHHRDGKDGEKDGDHHREARGDHHDQDGHRRDDRDGKDDKRDDHHREARGDHGDRDGHHRDDKDDKKDDHNPEEKNAVLANDPDGVIGLLNIATGDFEVIGESGVSLTDLDVSPKGDLGYGVSFAAFYTIDLTTGAATPVGATGATLNALEVGPDGTIYAAGPVDTNLYVIDPTTGSATVAFDLGFASAGDLQFVSGILYMASTDDSLIAIDVAASTATEIGAFGVSDVFGLALGDDGDLVGLGSDGSISLIDLDTGTASPVSSADRSIFGGATLEDDHDKKKDDGHRATRDDHDRDGRLSKDDHHSADGGHRDDEYYEVCANIPATNSTEWLMA